MILVYSIVDEQSFQEMGRWLRELKEHLNIVGEGATTVHVVGTKSDVVASDPSARRVPFERCIAYVAEHLYPTLDTTRTPPMTAGGISSNSGVVRSSDSKRSSGFWGQDIGWDCCHEISSSSGEGIEEVFRVITRKLVEQESKKGEHGGSAATGDGSAKTPGTDSATCNGYFDRVNRDGMGSFRVGHGDKRKSWLGFPTPSIGIADEVGGSGGGDGQNSNKRRCC